MAIIAEVDITLDVHYGEVDYGLLDEVISDALRRAGVPVLDVEVAGMRQLGAIDSGLGAAAPSPLGPPSPFGTRI